MSPSIVSSVLSILLTSSLVILVSVSSNISAATPSSVQFACSYTTNHTDAELCLRILQTIPKVVAAKEQISLCVAILESGISNSTKTLRRVESLLNQTVNHRVKGTLHMCKLRYNEVVTQFTRALKDVKEFDYYDARYELLTAIADHLIPCENILAERNVTDPIILLGNRVATIFAYSANKVVEELEAQSRNSPPPSAAP